MKKYGWLAMFLVLLFSCAYHLKVEKKETKTNLIITELNAEWAIVEVNGEKVVKEKSTNLPYLAFNAADSSLTGSTGCNRITGKSIVKEGVVEFLNLATTRMYCMNNSYETPLLQLLRGSLSYHVENDRLIFSKEGRRVIVLQK